MRTSTGIDASIGTPQQRLSKLLEAGSALVSALATQRSLTRQCAGVGRTEPDGSSRLELCRHEVAACEDRYERLRARWRNALQDAGDP